MLPQLRALTQAARPAALRHFVGQTFEDLTRLLGYLDAVDGAAAGDDPQPLFSIIHGEGLSLSDYIEAHKSEPYAEGPLGEALESAAFAIRHELRRVFERELVRAEAGGGGDARRARAGDAAEVLRNCFQQAVVIVARALDDAVSDVTLFGDIHARRERSQRLCEDLDALLRLIRHIERQYSQQAFTLFTMRLQDFRLRSMRYLMQKDWAMVEGFAAQVPSLHTERAVKAFLHQFGSYLEILLSHVRMRAVLAG